MVKKITRMALVCLAMLCMSSTETTSIDTRPYVRAAFQYNEVIAYPGHPFDIIIFFRNTSRLFVYREDNFTLEEIILNAAEGEINNTEEKMRTHTVVIDEPDYTVRYTIIAVSEDGREAHTYVSYHTYPNPEL